MGIPTEITVNWLRSQLACDDQVALFRATFGETTTVSRNNLLRAASAGLDMAWFVRRLSPEFRVAVYVAIGPAERIYGVGTEALRVEAHAAFHRWRGNPWWRPLRRCRLSREFQEADARFDRVCKLLRDAYRRELAEVLAQVLCPAREGATAA